METFPRLKSLSQPIHRPINTNKTYNESYRVKQSALHYVASKRILQLAKPKKEPIEIIIFKPNIKKISQKKLRKPMKYKYVGEAQSFCHHHNKKTNYEIYTAKNSALNYITSERINTLAEPKKITKGTLIRSNFEEYSRKRLLKAMKYEASDRIKELSKPKASPSKTVKDKEDPFKVKAESLSARCSDRTKMLAKPLKRS